MIWSAGLEELHLFSLKWEAQCVLWKFLNHVNDVGETSSKLSELVLEHTILIQKNCVRWIYSSLIHLARGSQTVARVLLVVLWLPQVVLQVIGRFRLYLFYFVMSNFLFAFKNAFKFGHNLVLFRSILDIFRPSLVSI